MKGWQTRRKEYYFSTSQFKYDWWEYPKHLFSTLNSYKDPHCFKGLQPFLKVVSAAPSLNDILPMSPKYRTSNSSLSDRDCGPGDQPAARATLWSCRQVYRAKSKCLRLALKLQPICTPSHPQHHAVCYPSNSAGTQHKMFVGPQHLRGRGQVLPTVPLACLGPVPVTLQVCCLLGTPAGIAHQGTGPGASQVPSLEAREECEAKTSFPKCFHICLLIRSLQQPQETGRK